MFKSKETKIKKAWEKLRTVRQELARLKTEEDSIKAELINEATNQDLFKGGKTASFETGQKIRFIERPNIIKDKKFDVEGFLEMYPQMTKKSIDPKVLMEAFSEASLRKEITEMYDIKVGLKEYYKFEF